MADPIINIDQIIAEFGSQYRDGGQGLKDLRTLLIQQGETEALFEYLPTEDTIVYKATASITRVLQAYQDKFTPIGDTKFELENIPLDHIKVDVKILPQSIMPSWLGFLAKGSLDPATWPIVKYWLEKLVIPRLAKDKELYEVFKGVRGNITPGTPTLQGKSINGVRKKIRDGYAAGKTNQITLGAPPTDPVAFVEYVEAFKNSIDELMLNEITSFQMNKTLRTRFQTGMRKKYNMNYDQAGSLLSVIDTDIQVKGLASHAGSNMIWATVEGNTANPTKWGANAGIFDIQKVDREIKGLSDLWTGYGFWYLPYVFHNDQDLVDA